MGSSASAALTDLGRGVVALTSLGRDPREIASELAAHATAIERGSVDSIVFTPGPDGRELLMAPSSMVLLRQDVLSKLGDGIVEAVAGSSDLQDPVVALLDVQWKLQMLGQRVRTTDGPLPPDWQPAGAPARIRRTRGLLGMLQANLTQPLRGRLLTWAELAVTSSSLHESGSDTTILDLQRSPGGDGIGTASVPSCGLIGPFAIDQAVDDLAPSREARSRFDGERRVPDRALLPQIREALPMIVEQLGVRPESARSLAGLLGIDAELSRQVRVLVVAPDDGDAGERASALVSRLGARAHVRRSSTGSGLTWDGGRPVPDGAPDQVRWADALVLVSSTLDDVPGAGFSSTALIADLAALDVAQWLMNGPRTRYRSMALRDLMTRADLVIAADDVQRDVLLGALAGAERVNADVYDDDPSLGSLVATDPDMDRETAFCLRPVRAADAVRDADEEELAQPGIVQMVRTTFQEGGVRKVAARALRKAGRILPTRATNKED